MIWQVSTIIMVYQMCDQQLSRSSVCFQFRCFQIKQVIIFVSQNVRQKKQSNSAVQLLESIRHRDQHAIYLFQFALANFVIAIKVLVAQLNATGIFMNFLN